MSDEAAFLTALSAAPADDTARLVYADWLDDRDDPRGPYLRAECQWVEFWRHLRRKTDPKLRRLAAKLDPVWVARVSRPPVGVCIRTPRLRRDGPPATEEEIDAVAAEFGAIFPPEYRAFHLNHNSLSTQMPDHPDWEFEFLGSVKDVEATARRLFANCHESNRRCGLFPIGGLADGANSLRTLLGVTYPNARKSRLFGGVFHSSSGHQPWLNADDDFIEDARWGYKALGSLCELLADWDHAASRYADEG